MIDNYLDLEIYTFLIKNCDIKIFSLSIFIKVRTSRFLIGVIIFSININKRDRLLIEDILNTSIMNIKFSLFSY